MQRLRSVFQFTKQFLEGVFSEVRRYSVLRTSGYQSKTVRTKSVALLYGPEINGT